MFNDTYSNVVLLRLGFNKPQGILDHLSGFNRFKVSSCGARIIQKIVDLAVYAGDLGLKLRGQLLELRPVICFDGSKFGP